MKKVALLLLIALVGNSLMFAVPAGAAAGAAPAEVEEADLFAAVGGEKLSAEEAEETEGGIIGAIVGAAASIAVQLISTGEVNWGHVAVDAAVGLATQGIGAVTNSIARSAAVEAGKAVGRAIGNAYLVAWSTSAYAAGQLLK